MADVKNKEDMKFSGVWLLMKEYRTDKLNEGLAFCALNDNSKTYSKYFLKMNDPNDLYIELLPDSNIAVDEEKRIVNIFFKRPFAVTEEQAIDLEPAKKYLAYLSHYIGRDANDSRYRSTRARVTSDKPVF